MTTNQTIVGHWNVVEKQWNYHGAWIHEYEFEPGEWTMDFHPNGRMCEDFNVVGHPREYQTGTWAQDPNTGIIYFTLDVDPDHGENTLIVFDEEDGGPWLYFVEDAPHIRSDRATLMAHHAHERHRLTARLFC